MSWRWYVYILHCQDSSYYTGLTRQPNTRWTQHLSGLGAKYTAEHKPDKIMYAVVRFPRKCLPGGTPVPAQPPARGTRERQPQPLSVSWLLLHAIGHKAWLRGIQLQNDALHYDIV